MRVVDDQRVGVRDVDARLDDRGGDEARRPRRGGRRPSRARALLVHLAVDDVEADRRAQPRRAGASRRSSATRLCTKNAWPPRSCSRSSAWRTSCSSHGRRASRPPGAPPASREHADVAQARAATTAACAGSASPTCVSTSTCMRSWLSSSFCLTPKRCSSSMISRPRSLTRTSRESRRGCRSGCRPRPRRAPLDRLAPLLGACGSGEMRDRERVVGQALGEGPKCCWASIVVGTSISTWWPSADRLERGAHRDLGLAEADVAADQAVHRPIGAPCRP